MGFMGILDNQNGIPRVVEHAISKGQRLFVNSHLWLDMFSLDMNYQGFIGFWFSAIEFKE